MEFVSINTILNKLHRELQGSDISEGDVIEWCGEALEFLSTPYSSESVVTLLKVENFECALPEWLRVINQIVKYNKEVEPCEQDCEMDKACETADFDLCDDSCSECCESTDILTQYLMGTLNTSYRPYFDMNMPITAWSNSYFFQKEFTPVRLSNHSFFHTIVCSEAPDLYKNCIEEYTIVGTTERKLRFSFKDGYIAISYVRAATEDGLPLIPDDVRYLTAVSYYCRWKIAEYKSWQRIEGFDGLAVKTEQQWLKYCKQAKNFAMMPKGVDEYQNLLEQSLRLVPKKDAYYTYFGNLSKFERLKNI